MGLAKFGVVAPYSHAAAVLVIAQAFMAAGQMVDVSAV
jgi:hypothetical protein